MVYSTRRFVVCLSVCHFVLVFFSPFSIAITSLGEERANLSAFRTFVRFVLVWICRFPLPLGVWEGLRFVIVALPGLFSYLLFCSMKLNIIIEVPRTGKTAQTKMSPTTTHHTYHFIKQKCYNNYRSSLHHNVGHTNVSAEGRQPCNENIVCQTLTLIMLIISVKFPE